MRPCMSGHTSRSNQLPSSWNGPRMALHTSAARPTTLPLPRLSSSRLGGDPAPAEPTATNAATTTTSNETNTRFLMIVFPSFSLVRLMQEASEKRVAISLQPCGVRSGGGVRKGAVEHVVELCLRPASHRSGEEISAAKLERAGDGLLVETPLERLEVGAHLGQQRVGCPQ